MEIDVLSPEFDEYMEWFVASVDCDQVDDSSRIEREFSTWKMLKSQMGDGRVPAMEGLPDLPVVSVQEGLFCADDADCRHLFVTIGAAIVLAFVVGLVLCYLGVIPWVG